MQMPPSLHSSLQHRLSHSFAMDHFNAITSRVASGKDRGAIIDVINTVAGERTHLQTDRYRSTPKWEKLLSEGMDEAQGFLLLAIEDRSTVIGFARLYPDDNHSMGRKAANVGIALRPSYRSKGIGAIILNTLVGCATELDYLILTANILETNTRSKKLFARRGFREVSCYTIFLDFLNDHVNELYYEAGLSHPREAIEDDF